MPRPWTNFIPRTAVFHFGEKFKSKNVFHFSALVGALKWAKKKTKSETLNIQLKHNREMYSRLLVFDHNEMPLAGHERGEEVHYILIAFSHTFSLRRRFQRSTRNGKKLLFETSIFARATSCTKCIYHYTALARLTKRFWLSANDLDRRWKIECSVNIILISVYFSTQTYSVNR